MTTRMPAARALRDRGRAPAGAADRRGRRDRGARRRSRAARRAALAGSKRACATASTRSPSRASCLDRAMTARLGSRRRGGRGPRSPRARPWRRRRSPSRAAARCHDVRHGQQLGRQRVLARRAPSLRGGARFRRARRRPSSRMACSIGSKGVRWLARIANSTSSWNSSGKRPPRPATSSGSSAATRRETAIRFSRERAGLVDAEDGRRRRAPRSPAMRRVEHVAGARCARRRARGRR